MILLQLIIRHFYRAPKVSKYYSSMSMPVIFLAWKRMILFFGDFLKCKYIVELLLYVASYVFM